VPLLRHALGGTHFCAQSRGRNSFPLISPWGQNLPPNRALGLAASHTPGGKFPCRCPDRTRMSSGRDFFDRLCRAGQTCPVFVLVSFGEESVKPRFFARLPCKKGPGIVKWYHMYRKMGH